MISVSNISVKFRNALTFALNEISFNISKGEYIAILGPNGSGKSTLIKALCGFVPVESGNIRILGKDVRYGRFGDDFFGDIGVVFQEPQGQFLACDVRTEISSILQNLGLPHSQQKERFDEIVAEFGLQPLLSSKPENLSGGQMQLVNLACAICLKPKLLLMDEPTTFLDPYHKVEFLTQVNKLNNEGLTIIHVTQYPDEALLAQRVMVINNGRLARDGLSKQILNDEEMLKSNNSVRPKVLSFNAVFGFQLDDNTEAERFLGRCKRSRVTSRPTNNPINSNPALLIENLHYRYNTGGFEININKLGLNRGEVVGIVGPGGSGKSTLAFLIAGLLSPQYGQIVLNNKPLAEYHITELRQQIGITWQLPDLTLIGPTVRDDLEFGMRNMLRVNGDISAILGQVGLDGFENRIVDTLSGGEKRKLVLASILLTNPQYLILDEPEAFLDPSSQIELAGIIKKLSANRRGILLIAHDLYFLSGTVERIIGLAEGKVVFDISAMAFFSDTSYLAKLGLPAAPIIRFRERLTKEGITLSTTSLNPEMIEQSLK